MGSPVPCIADLLKLDKVIPINIDWECPGFVFQLIMKQSVVSIPNR